MLCVWCIIDEFLPELLGDMWGSKEERLHQRNIVSLTNNSSFVG